MTEAENIERNRQPTMDNLSDPEAALANNAKSPVYTLELNVVLPHPDNFLGGRIQYLKDHF